METLVKYYGAVFSARSVARKFRKDAKRLAEQGWRVQSHSQSYAYFGFTHHKITAVYER